MSFKIFRKYNKVLLVFGVSALMIVFLLEGAIPMFTSSNPSKVVIGTLHGKPVTLAQQQQAAFDYSILTQLISPQSRGVFNPAMLGKDASTLFMLFLADAQRLGISASTTEARQTIDAMEITDAQMKLFAKQMRVTPESIVEAMRANLTVSLYLDLTLGRPGGMGSRLSGPMLNRVIFDLMSKASGTGVIIPVEKAVEKKQPVTPAQLADLFDRYKNDLSGQGKPYGFGFKAPAQVQIEYLAVPASQLRSKVTVDEVEALDFYDKNPHYFTAPADPAATQPASPKTRPYDEVAGEVRLMLRDKKISELADKIVRFASNLLAADIQSLPDVNGYKEILPSFKPTALADIQKRVNEQFGVLPEVIIRGDQWMDSADLQLLQGISNSYITGRRNAGFNGYVMSARELDPSKENPYLPLRLQVGVPSLPLSGFDGSRYIFRLTAARPSQAPKSLDEVIIPVTRAAEKVNAWETAQKDISTWAVKAASQPSMADFAKSLDLRETKLEDIGRRDEQSFGTPFLPGIGENELFVDTFFKRAVDLAAKGPIGKAPAKDRIIAVPLENQMAIAVFKIDSLTPPSKSLVDMITSQPQFVVNLESQLVTRPDDGLLDLKQVEKRLQYVPAAN